MNPRDTPAILCKLIYFILIFWNNNYINAPSSLSLLQTLRYIPPCSFSDSWPLFSIHIMLPLSPFQSLTPLLPCHLCSVITSGWTVFLAENILGFWVRFLRQPSFWLSFLPKPHFLVFHPPSCLKLSLPSVPLLCLFLSVLDCHSPLKVSVPSGLFLVSWLPYIL